MLPTVLSIGMFVAAVVVTSFASVWLTNGLEKLGARLRLPEALLGILTALGADAPEIASAVAALHSRHHNVALGIVLGSNVFNLAGLLGVSALVAGRVEMGRHGLLITGGVGVLATLAIAALVEVEIPAGSTLFLLTLLLAPYVVLSSLQPPQIQRLKLPRRVRHFLATAVEHAHQNARKRDTRPLATLKDAGVMLASLGLILASSVAMVRIAVALANRWGVPHAIVGTLVLAALTSLPNVAAAVHLAREGRGAAVVSETFNSNTINVLVGVCLPALVFGVQPPSGPIAFSVVWLLGMSLVAVVAAGFPKGLHRRGGLLIVGLYAIYVAVIVSWRGRP